MARDYGVTVAELATDSLVGGHPPITEGITLVSGAEETELERGTVLAVVTASGKYTGLAPDGEDGSQTAAAILAEAVTVPATGDEVAIVYVHGEFDRSSLVWTDDGITDSEKTAAYADLKAAGIYTK